MEKRCTAQRGRFSKYGPQSRGQRGPKWAETRQPEEAAAHGGQRGDRQGQTQVLGGARLSTLPAAQARTHKEPEREWTPHRATCTLRELGEPGIDVPRAEGTEATVPAEAGRLSSV